MWNLICTKAELELFLERMWYFHDSCVKEIKYTSGAYVNEDRAMRPINSCRKLNVIIQRQCKVDSTIELEFCGLKYLKLYPVNENYTCEILDSTMLIKDDTILWYDSDDLTEENISDYGGTIICASKLRWRVIDNGLGKHPIYDLVR